MIRDNHLDVLAICESWIADDAPDAVKNDIAPTGYSVLHVHRPRTSGVAHGGLAFIHRNDLHARPLKTKFSPASFELQLVGLQVSNILIKIANVYRPPDRSKAIFLEEFEDLLMLIGPGIGERLLVCGDFNMPGEDSATIDARLFALLEVHGYQQHVTQPTRHGPGKDNDSLLDLLITPTSAPRSLLSNVAVCSSHDLSDHDLVVGDLSAWRHKPAAVSYEYRNIRDIDVTDLERRIRSSRLFTDPAETPDEYVDQMESTLSEIMDHVAPLRHGTRAGGSKGAKWLDREAVEAKQCRRRLERRWKRSGGELDRVAYRAACRRANKLINQSRNRHRYQRVAEAGRSSRRVWSAVKDLLYTSDRGADTPSTDNDATFCSVMAAFFTNKVRNIKSAISLKLDGQRFDPLSSDQLYTGELLSQFEPVTEAEVERLIRSMSAKSSPLDVISTSLIKACSGTFAQMISRLANLTFEYGKFPVKFKTAQVTPLLKKRGLDAGDPASFRPISNLNTVSKMLERLVLARIVPHVAKSPSFDVSQSAYRKCHSTETAMLRVTSDILSGFDANQSTILVALDQSAAFDCIDHSTLIRRLRRTFGIDGTALGWLESYLEDRSAFVRWKKASSDVFPLTTGVPQGSALGPLLFSLFIAPLSGVIRSFGVMHHQYADDTQIYIEASRSNSSVRLEQLERCTVGVHEWLLQNGLQLNPKKSEVIQFTACNGRQRVDDITSVAVSDADIQPSPVIKSLGVTLDSRLTFDDHVAEVCRACYCHIRALRHIRESLPSDVARTVACSIVGSRLDYCNSLFVGMSRSNFNKLQRVQNTLAKVVLRRRKFEHATPALIELHWLPVEHRVTFKLATLVHKIKTSGQPIYLRELLRDYEPGRNLRSATKNLLCEGRVRTVLASRAFTHSAAAVWNRLPDFIRNCNSISIFKRHLKTHLFNHSFNT